MLANTIERPMIADLREVFSIEECEIIHKMTEDGNHEHISSIVDIDSPEKERALQVHLDAIRGPVRNPNGSAVRQEMEMRLARGEEIIQSPEDEAEWQAKLDAEARGETVKIELKEKALTKEEIIIALKQKGVEFNEHLKKGELKTLLANAA